jgi:hypothetical protein
MMMNLTDRQQLQTGTRAAATMMWQPCLSLPVVGLSNRLSSLSAYTFNDNGQESIRESAIKDRRHLKS